MKKIILTAAFALTILTLSAQVSVETLGTVTANTTIAAHQAAKGFANKQLSFSGSAELQQQGSSEGKYTNASGGANLRFANVPETDFVISGINTIEIMMPVIGFGILKGPDSANGSELVVEYSTDGGSKWAAIKYPALPTGAGTGLVWNYRETAPIPKVANLTVRFRQTGKFVVFRIDDIAVKSLQGSN